MGSEMCIRDSVMIGEFGEVYLVDWGVALELPGDAGPRHLVGTPQFLAPEMLDAQLPLGPWTDVYLLGATLHQVLTGRARHSGDDLRSVLAAAWDSRAFGYASEVPAELAELCNRATARDPERRVRSAADFRSALKDYLLHKSSLAMAREADERLDRLAELRRRPDHDRGEAMRAAAECRFGHLMALREWSENPVAGAGLQRALGRLVEIELDAENVAGAEAWLAELRDAPADLRERTAAVAARVAERAGAEARLRQLEHDRDLAQGSGARRAVAFVMIAAVFSICGIALYLRTQAHALTAATSVWFAAATIVVVTCAAFFVRRSLLATDVSRRLMATFLFGLTLMLAQRVLATLRGESIPHILQTDALLLCAVVGATGFMVAPIWLVGSAAALVGATAIHFLPDAAEGIFMAVGLTCIGFLGFGSRRQG